MVENNNNEEQTGEQNAPKIEEKSSVKKCLIEDEMKTAYLDYAMSVIIGRALPDIRDGLKPVHRRILFAMNELGMVYNKPSKKCARIVGEVLGKYHPHGDSAVYDSLVRMAQDFSLRYPLIKGQGNFGSIDGDNAAAMRYTEAKLSKISDYLLTDINKETVDFRLNFDESLKEPTVLPTKLPNLLINGSNGIAVGMATNIPPHNISEIIEGIKLILKNKDCDLLELVDIVKGPDFPTGGNIIGKSGILNAYNTGRGKIKVRGKTHLEDIRGRKAIIIDEIPYQVNKSSLIEQIADNVRDKKIEGVHNIRDESDKKGMRIVIELKKDSNEEVISNQLFKHSRLQTTIGMIFLSIVNNQPKVLGLKEILTHFINHRKEVIVRRTEYDLKKAEKKAHILEGLTKALENIDTVISLIKQAKSSIEAKNELQTRFDFSEIQAQAILDMKLQKLTNLEQDKLKDEYKEILKLIEELKGILESEEKVKQIIKEELEELENNFGDIRKTEIIDQDYEDIEDEDLIPREDQVVTITKTGYAKRLGLDTYRQQNRGGKGVIGAQMKEEDIVEHLFVANTHNHLLIFTDKGQVHWLKVYKLPEGSKTSKGKAIINLVNIAKGEEISAIIPVKQFVKDEYLLIATEKGVIKKTSLEAYSRPRQNGIIGIKLDEDDKIITVRKTNGEQNILLASKKGQAIRFSEKDARPIGRTSRGVRGMSLAKDDKIIGMIRAEDNGTILTITENGYGKRTAISDYRLIGRGGKGVRNIICSPRNGMVASIRLIKGDEDVLLISKKGIVMRTSVSQISTIGRNTQGVRIMNLSAGDSVRKVAVLEKNEEINENEINENQNE